MRVVGGSLKGRRFNPPNNIPTRPTTDIAKEGLFNILNNYWNFDNVNFCDLFGGTGSITYEFASRGCTDINNIELFPKCHRFIEKTCKEFGIDEFVTAHNMDVFQFMKINKRQYDLIFAGPPYPLENLDEIPDLLFEHEMLTEVGWFILEHNQNHNFTDHPHFFKVKNYGQTNFSFFQIDPTKWA